MIFPFKITPPSSACCVCAHWLSCAWLVEKKRTVVRQVLLPVGFSRQEYWGGLSFPLPGDLPNPGMKPVSPVSLLQQADSLPLPPSSGPCSIFSSTFPPTNHHSIHFTSPCMCILSISYLPEYSFHQAGVFVFSLFSSQYLEKSLVHRSAWDIFFM